MKKYTVVFHLLFFTSIIYSQTIPPDEFPLTVKDYFGNSQILTFGYHRFGTDGLDTLLGEVHIPQVPQGQFGARFKLPADTNITTVKDMRFSCGQVWLIKHRINISYQNTSPNCFIFWDEGYWGMIYELKFINPHTGQVLGQYSFPISADTLELPALITDIDLLVYYNTPLSWSSYNLYSPNGGEVFKVGDTVTVNYHLNLPYPTGMGLLELSTDYGLTWIFADSISQYTSSHTWIIPNILSRNVKLRIGTYPCVYDSSDGTFLIYSNTPPVLHLVQIPIRINNSVGDTVDILAGMHPNATNGLDSILGETNQSPPLAGEFGAFVRLGDTSLSHIDYRPGYHFYWGAKNYELKVYPKSDSVTTLNMYLPQGANCQLKFIKRFTYGIFVVDTIFSTQHINYTFTEETRYDYPINLIITFDGTIPVELQSFTANINDKNVDLNWITSTETNNMGFQIDRVRDIQKEAKWEQIGFVEGKGTTTEINFYSFTDKNLNPGKYSYRLKQIDFDGSFFYSEEIEIIVGSPDNFYLSQNFPNPFNPVTKISWQSPFAGLQTLKIYDVLGNEVATLVDEEKGAGLHELEFDASNFSSGIYFYTLRISSFRATRKMVLLK